MFRLPIAAAGAAASAYALSSALPSSALPTSLIASAAPSKLAFAPAPEAGVIAAPGPFGNPAHDWSYYQKCMVGGLMACGLTHAAVTPLDVVKCRMQVMPGQYKGLLQGLPIVAKEGSLFLGVAPTLLGYSAQGLFKYGFYEIFKDVYTGAVDPETAQKYRAVLWAAASASAEFFADMALSPFESTKVAMQTSKPELNFPNKFGPAVSKLLADKGPGVFYKILVPLWGRQIPYTIAKFVFFEAIVEAFYTHVFTEPKSSYSKPTQLGITFSSGYLAGVLCAVVSHPADTLVSKLNQPGATVGGIMKDIGFGGLWKGLGTRIVMVGTLTGLQWWIYDTFKAAAGLQTSGGKK
jgi:solute carrier family 25 phosphate transporter 3